MDGVKMLKTSTFSGMSQNRVVGNPEKTVVELKLL